MLRQDVVFTAEKGLTPDFAAKLSQQASSFESEILIECNGKQLRLDSLISILAIEMHCGVRVTVIADGADEREAIQAIEKTLVG